MKEKFTKSFAIPLLLMIFCQFANAQYKYGNVAMGGGGYVDGIITSRQVPNLLYCRTDVGGAYRWDNANSKWIPLLDWVNKNVQSGYVGVESIAIDPRNSNYVYMVCGTIYTNNGQTAILKSNNRGNTFTVVNVTSQFKMHGNGSGRGTGERLQVDPNSGNILWLGTRDNGLFKSIDSGLTWTRQASLPVLTTKQLYGGIGTGISTLLLDSASGTVGNPTPNIYAWVSTVDSTNNFYVSKDAGATFNPVPMTGGPNPRRVMAERAALASDGNMYITYDSLQGPGSEKDANGAVWKFNTTTNVWTDVTPVPHITVTGLGFGGICVDPQNPLRIISSTVNTYKLQYGATYGDRFYLTNDGGATWTNLVPAGGYGGTNMIVNANGIPWANGQSIHWAGSIEFDPFNTNKAWVGSGNGIFTCNDLNSLTRDNVVNTWNFVAQGIEETVPNDMVSIPGGPFFSVISDYDGFKQTDITKYSTGGRYTPTTGTTNGIAYASLNPNILVRVGGSLNFTNDQGVTWTTKTRGGNGTNGKIALSADGSTILHCPTGTNSANNTYRSTDNGGTWTICSRIKFNGAVPVADPVNPLKFYAYNSNNGFLLRSVDGGVSFTDSFFIASGGSKLIRTTPGVEGDIWLALNSASGGGLKHVTTWGSYTTVTGSPAVAYCSSVGLGKPIAPNTNYAVYVWGTVGGVEGIHGSADGGITWMRLNDDDHEWGAAGNGQFVMGDMNISGRFYMSTSGRGIVYGDSTTAQILPITLLSFYGSIISKNQTGLKWQTANESNNSYFDVERSLDGKTFSKIGAVNSRAINGNSSQILGYAYADDVSGLNGLVYYRLKQVDKDGKSAYSNIITINIADNKTESVLVFPNPASSNNINLKIQLATNKNVKVHITNMLGEIVYSGEKLPLAAGNNFVKLNGTIHLAKGTYLVDLVGEENQQIVSRSKVVIQ